MAQLWRCPVSWCTVRKGTPKDCMDHIRGGGGRMMFRGKSSRPAWNTFFRRGLLHVRCGRTPWNLSTREYQRTFSCSVTSTCRWCTITGSTCGVSRISHSGITTCPSCARCCLCRWLSLWMGCYRQPRPALGRYVRLGLRRSWESRPGRPDVLIDGFDQCMWCRRPLGTFWENSGSFGCQGGGGGFRLSASVATSVSGYKWVDLLSGRPPAVSVGVEVLPSEHGPSFGGGTRMDWSFRSLGLLH